MFHTQSWIKMTESLATKLKWNPVPFQPQNKQGNSGKTIFAMFSDFKQIERTCKKFMEITVKITEVLLLMKTPKSKMEFIISTQIILTYIIHEVCISSVLHPPIIMMEMWLVLYWWPSNWRWWLDMTWFDNWVIYILNWARIGQ